MDMDMCKATPLYLQEGKKKTTDIDRACGSERVSENNKGVPSEGTDFGNHERAQMRQVRMNAERRKLGGLYIILTPNGSTGLDSPLAGHNTAKTRKSESELAGASGLRRCTWSHVSI
jgi:hypothetical protein